MTGQMKSGLWSSITSMLPFGGGSKDKEDTAKKAHLPEGSSFVYDPELKKWVNKKGGPVAEKDDLVPPPIVPSSVSANPRAAKIAETPNSAPSPLPGQIDSTLVSDSGTKSSEKGNSSKKRSARSKYVDVMNPNASADSAPAVPQFGIMPPLQQSTSQPRMMVMMVRFSFSGCV